MPLSTASFFSALMCAAPASGPRLPYSFSSCTPMIGPSSFQYRPCNCLPISA